MRLVEESLNSSYGYSTLLKKYGIPSFELVSQWMKLSERFSARKLNCSPTYSVRFILNIINYNELEQVSKTV